MNKRLFGVDSVMDKIEYFPLVNSSGEVVGKATREQCHSGLLLMHPVVHLHVFNSAGELYLQKRGMQKDIQPNKWDTAVGGHLDYGEEVAEALVREAREELGITDFKPIFIQRYKFVSSREVELVNSFYTVYDGVINPNPEEISEGRFWKKSDIDATIGDNIFSTNFVQEYRDTIRDLYPQKR